MKLKLADANLSRMDILSHYENIVSISQEDSENEYKILINNPVRTELFRGDNKTNYNRISSVTESILNSFYISQTRNLVVPILSDIDVHAYSMLDIFQKNVLNAILQNENLSVITHNVNLWKNRVIPLTRHNTFMLNKFHFIVKSDSPSFIEDLELRIRSGLLRFQESVKDIILGRSPIVDIDTRLLGYNGTSVALKFGIFTDKISFTAKERNASKELSEFIETYKEKMVQNINTRFGSDLVNVRGFQHAIYLLGIIWQTKSTGIHFLENLAEEGLTDMITYCSDKKEPSECLCDIDKSDNEWNAIYRNSVVLGNGQKMPYVEAINVLRRIVDMPCYRHSHSNFGTEIAHYLQRIKPSS